MSLVNKFFYFLIFIVSLSCNDATHDVTSADSNQYQGKPIFTMLDASKTGLDFDNKLELTTEMNIFKYMYFYNGGGVASADFNNDGLMDILFIGNLVDNKMYINKGHLKFEDITAKTGIVNDSTWSNGATVVDINQDGMMDIYISQVGSMPPYNGHNTLYVCKSIKDGLPTYAEESKKYGLDLSGYGTQAAFFDYDLDGDLDMYQLNHSTHANGTFGQKNQFIGTYHPTSGDRFFKNDNGKYKEVTRQCGINSTVIGYGLGIVVSDVNMDGFPDIYIGNDFHENDYLYINQRNGTFREALTDQMMHTSRFSMGIDAADINNDCLPDIISLDMLPENREILKRSENDEDVALYKFKIDFGYNYQYSRNCLQINNGNNTFSDVALMAGVYATDWSWSPLFIDFDNNGVKDLYISNGIPKRMNDLDYINFVSDPNWQWKTKSGELTSEEIKMITKFPEIKLNNKFYLNQGNLKFQDLSNTIENALPSYSNGTAYADFDNDGDMDIVVNNINDKAFVYRNNASAISKNKSVTVKIKGGAKNKSGIGTKIISYAGGQKQLHEYYPVRGFQSSSTQFPIIGVDTYKIDSMIVVWPDNKYEVVKNVASQIEFNYKKELPSFDYKKFNQRTYDFVPPKIVNTTFKFEDAHKENPYVEFHREPLIAMSCGEQGPAGAVADINGDGLEDMYIGKSKGYTGKLYIQQSSGTFSLVGNKDFAADSMYEDSDAKFIDVNGDQFVDLIVASGGNEYSLKNAYTQPRLYLNDGKGIFTRSMNAFINIHSSSSKIALEDINKDGYIDLFLCSRATPYSYGIVPDSYLLLNDGKGEFKDVTDVYSTTLKKSGFVKDAKWIDIDNDKDNDLVLAAEWSELQVYVREGKTLVRKNITADKGWWNLIHTIDYDNDGDLDIIAGNQGLNSRLHPSKDQPVRMYFGDFDDNDTKEQVITYYLGGKEIPLSNKTDIEKKIPRIKKQFLKASDFAKASIEDIFLKKYLDKSIKFEANQFANLLLINDGKGNFTQQALPQELQYAPLISTMNYDIDKDGRLDVLVGMNDYSTSVLLGRYDANYGGVLLNKKSGFEYSNFDQTIVRGQVRRIMSITIKGKPYFIYLRNNDSTLVFSF